MEPTVDSVLRYGEEATASTDHAVGIAQAGAAGVQKPVSFIAVSHNLAGCATGCGQGRSMTGGRLTNPRLWNTPPPTTHLVRSCAAQLAHPVAQQRLGRHSAIAM
jgi:hypothetical protein